LVALSKNIEKVARQVLSDEAERQVFFQALADEDRGVSAVAWLHSEPVSDLYQRHDNRPGWLPAWIEVAADSARPGKLSEHDAGDLYILDLSSTFALAPLSIVAERVQSILDVCAAPGGKGILAWRYCAPDLIIANEVIRKRTAQLIANYKRCKIAPAMVSSCDPGLLAKLIPNRAGLVIVDAPCSGQSLVLKGMAAPGAFHPATISMNERRQRRILANSAQTVSPGGYLIYSTCTFSREENEDNVEWFCKKFPEFAALEVPMLDGYRSPLSELATYRLFPHHGFGAGAFVAIFRRDGEGLGLGDLPLTEANIADSVWPVWRSC